MSVTVEIDEELAKKIDDATRELHQKREDFVHDALLKALKKLDLEARERQAVEAYRKNPVHPDEFFVEEEQLIEVWKDI